MHTEQFTAVKLLTNRKSLTQTDPEQPIPSKNAGLPDLDGSMPAYTITAPGNYFLTENLVGDKPVVILSDDRPGKPALR